MIHAFYKKLVLATMKVKATTKSKASTRAIGKTAMKLKTQETGHLDFLNMILEGEGSNNFVRVHICDSLVTEGRSYTVFLKTSSHRREDSLKRQYRILKTMNTQEGGKFFGL